MKDFLENQINQVCLKIDLAHQNETLCILVQSVSISCPSVLRFDFQIGYEITTLNPPSVINSSR